MISTRVKKSVEWHTNDSPASPPNPTGFIGMDNAENWLIRPEALPVMRKAMQRDFDADDLSYSRNIPGEVELLEATAAFFNKFFAPRVPVAADHVVTQGGAMEILDCLVYSVCDEGEALLIDAPFWGGFGNAAHLRNANRLVEVARPVDFADKAAIVRHYEKALEGAPCRVRGIMVCNPHNPYGHIYPTVYLEAVLEFCEKHDIHCISDEIYGLTTWGHSNHHHPESKDVVESPEKKFTSVLSLDLKKLKINPARVHIVYGISKDLGSSGLRLGILVTQNNPELREGVFTVERYTVSSATAVLTQALLQDLRTTEAWLEHSRSLLRKSADYATGFLAFHQVPFYRPVAGVFVWARLGGRDATEASDLALWGKTSAAGAALAYGAAFHEKERGWFRITFALPRDDLVEGLRRIETGMGKKRRYEAPLDTKPAQEVEEEKTGGCVAM
ncbi:PLP-dependent transferase [Apiospora marii]|uniref:PLP-dependent transferase n=1 Tax=Apiospora marii TaxID=335849 RepID=UPI00312DF7F1